MTSLKKQGVKGFTYSFTSHLTEKILSFLGAILLARMLMPDDFGLVTMLYIIFDVSSTLVRSGFSVVIVREKEITEEDKATVFYLNLFTSISLYLLLWFLAPAISDFYGRSELVVLTRLMALNLIFNSITIIQYASLKRDLKFRLLSIVSVASGLSTVVIPVILAYVGWGVYALVVKFVIGNFVAMILLYTLNPWRPKSFINKQSVNKLLGFSLNVLVYGILNSITRNINQVVIGKYYTTSSLGFFNQGKIFNDTLVKAFNYTVMDVTFPLLAKLQSDKERIKEGYKRIIEVNSFIIYPFVAILIVTAEPMVLGLLGSKWENTIIFVQIIGLTGFVLHLHEININILKIYAKGSDYFMPGLIRNVIIIIGIVITVNISVTAIAWALVISEYLFLFVNTYYSNKYIEFKVQDQIKSIFPIVLITILMGTSMYLLGNIFTSNLYLLKLIILSITGIIIYIILAFLFKINALYEVREIITSRVADFKKQK